ncbi:MAG: tRNA epoxyqueuosine(34) reductase QueG [Magnetococcales bacterium]|nr:tRNA epoxyqueuosine(34) reductase QueG [Magnetococcales bacterium]
MTLFSKRFIKVPYSNNAWLDLKEALRLKALEEGFDVVGFAPPQLPPHASHLDHWLAEKAHGGMAWMDRHAERRKDPRLLMEGLGVMVVLGVSYAPGFDAMRHRDHPERPWIASYALHNDYHEVIKKRLKRLARWLESELGYRPDGRIFVDTAPVMEKPIGTMAGLGWQGKNTMLVSRSYGNWLFLSEFFLALPIPADTPFEKDHCGSCDRCQVACPTGALDRAYHLDASRCLSYITIEHDGPIPLDLRQAMGNRIFGCDDCLGVCPWNRFASPHTDDHFMPREVLVNPDYEKLLALDEEGFRAMFRRSPIKRTGRLRMRRNIAVALGNWPSVKAKILLQKLMGDASELVRSHAQWGLMQRGKDMEKGDSHP